MEASLLRFADRLNETLPIIIKEFSRRQINELYKGKITLPQFIILDFLKKEGEAKMTDLSHFMGVSTAAMTGFVGRLVRDRYVERINCLEDRRIIKIRLTHKGVGLVEKINSQRRQMIVNTFGKIPQAERENYLKTLLHIRDILTQEKRN